jgi:hypothetical protein
MVDDRDRRTVKTPPAGVRAQTAAPVVELAGQTSEAIEDPDERQNWREANRTVTVRVRVVEGKVDGLVPIVHELRGSMDFLVESQRKSNDEREYRAECDARDRAQALERARIVAAEVDRRRERNASIVKSLIAIVVPLITAVGGIWLATR